MSSILRIRLNAIPSIGDTFEFTTTINGNVLSYSFEFVSSQSSPSNTAGQIPISGTIFGVISNISINFTLFYNSGLLYNLQMIGGNIQDSNGNPIYELIISCLNEFGTYIEISNNTNNAVSLNIDNTDLIDFTIDTYSVEEGSDPCNNFNLRVETSEQADGISQPASQIISSNPFLITGVQRGDIVNILAYKNSQAVNQLIRVPKLLSDYFDIQVLLTPFGSSINIIRLYPLIHVGNSPLMLTFEYSFDGGVTFSESNSRSGLPVGNYDLVVRDNLGCEISFVATVDEFTVNLIDYEAIAEVSNLNALAYKIKKDWDSCNNLKNNENTLSHEENYEINDRRYKQLFERCDNIPTQIKSNYPEHLVKLIDCEGNETNLNVIRKTQNMNRVDIREGFVHPYEGKAAIIFNSGNTYDPVTGEISGQYNIGETYMSWLNIGDYILIEGYGWARIENILPPAENNNPAISQNYRIITNANYIGVSLGGYFKVTSYFNTVNYERYEYTIPPNSVADRDYRIELCFLDNTGNFQEKKYISEWFNISDKLIYKHHLIEYYGSEGNEINFATGIQFRLRVPYLVNLKWSPDNEQEVNVTDTKTVTIENKVREFYELTSTPVPTKIAQKLVLALSQDRLKIDGITYTLEGGFDTVKYGQTNLYQVVAKLVKSDYVFKSIGGLTLGEVIIPSELPLSVDENSDGLLLL